MTIYLNVQRAALRLGVSPVTVRRWTANGFLPCTRTPGGHRRIAVDDIDQLSRSFGDGGHLAARVARERELETLVETAIAVSSQLDLGALLLEIARRVTRIMNCQFCSVAEYDRERDTVTALAEYDATGKRLPTPATYHLRAFPFTRKVLRDQVPGVVNADDPTADTAEVSALRREGDASILIVPLVYQAESIGVLEVIDNLRARRYSRQELRLCAAVAGQAAVALRNARLFERQAEGGEAGERLRRALQALAAAAPDLAVQPDRQAFLQVLADRTCDAFEAASCVATTGGLTAGAARGPAAGPASGAGAESADDARPAILVASAPASAGEAGDLRLTVALTRPAAPGHDDLLRAVAATAAAALARLP